MKNNICITAILFLLLNTTFVNAQKALNASFSQGSATSSTSSNTWNTVASTVLSLSAGTKVLVEATIEVEVTVGNSDINTQFRLTDGTTDSQTIDRYIATKTYTDKGIVAISFIFDYGAPLTESKTFSLEQAKTTTGASKQFTSKAVITAIEIASNTIILPNEQATTAAASTSSATYIAAATTNMITLEKTADIYIVSTFSTSTTDTSATGAWSLQESTDDDTFTDIPNSEITRSIIATGNNGIGAATIVTLIKNKPAGNYYFRLGHKVTNGTNITTSGTTISAVALRSTIATGDHVFPAYSDFPPNDTSTANSYEEINSAPITAPTNGFTDNKFFMHASYNMLASGNNVVYATYKFGSSAGGTLTLFEIQRYVPVDKTGSGGLIGIVNNINQGDSFNASFQHKNSGATGTLTSSNVNTIGFFLNSDPDSTLSIEEDILNTNIAIYPNPAQEQFYIKNNVTNGTTSITFYTVTGQLVHTIKVQPKTNAKLEVTGWTAGIYIMKVTNNGIHVSKKIIIE